MTTPDLVLSPISRVCGQVRLPGSKSISNRVLLLAALARGRTELSGLLDADDTRVMIDALGRLGVPVEIDEGVVRVSGCAGAWPVRAAELFLGNAGTAFRPLTAALGFAGGEYRLDGVARMRERPIGDLVGALRELGAAIDYLGEEGYPPLAIHAGGALARDVVEIRANVSSQFLSGLLMAAPSIAPEQGLRIRVAGELISQPYVALTLALMARFGVKVEVQGREFLVPRATYQAPGVLAVEGDASGASYFLALGAIAGGPVRVLGVGADSVQGDVRFAQFLERMGAQVRVGPDWIEAAAPARGQLHGIDADYTEIPDAAMTIAAAALFAEGPSVLRGIGSWRVKETDRIAAMATELRKLGASVEEGPDWLKVTPAREIRPAAIDTYDDHRMAMCFSLAACAGVPVTIRDPGCVAKTFPDYFDRLAGLVRP